MHMGAAVASKRLERRRCSLDVIKELNCAKSLLPLISPEVGGNLQQQGRRRTSLPTVLSCVKRKMVMSSVLVDSNTLGEVQSAIEELSVSQNNFDDVVKRLQSLLGPYKSEQAKGRPVFVSLEGEHSDDDAAPHLAHLVAAAGQPKRLRRSTQRFDFSTTTTATGLPTEEPQPNLKIHRLSKVSANTKSPLVSPLDSRCSSPTQQTARSRRRTCPNLTVTVPSYFSRLKSSAIDENATTASDEFKQRYHDASPANDNDQTAPPASRLMAQTDTPPMLRSRSVPAPTIPSTTTALERPSALAVPLSDSTVSSSSDTVQLGATLATNTPPVEFTPLFDESGVVVGSPSGGSVTAEEVPGDDLEPITADSEGRHYFGAEYRGDILSHVANWNFPIFDLAASTEHVLSQMAFKIFHDTGLFDTFNIPRQEFVRYMVLLESGYRPIPYHNRIHAADVLHGCWYLTTQEIAGFHQYSTIFSSDSSDSDSGTAGSNTRGQINHCTSVGGEVAGSLAQVIPALELMSLYLAAAMHDYDHPGRTNAFLVETRHPLAVMYNDRSVLENHHAAASWQLLYSDPKFDFLRNLDTAEWKRLRFLVIEAILSTDLKKHFDILSQFNSKAQHQQHRSRSPTEGVCDDQSLQQQRDLGIDWSCDEDRLLVCQMAIKLADIGGPAKEQTLHITWTKAICEEFFIQGDEERQLGVPVSPFMDRERPEVAELQRTFINNLIRPIVLSMYKAGLLAGETVDANDASDDETAETCLLVDQLNSNLAYWKTKTQSGFEEMREAFKLAHPVDLDRAASRSTRNRRRGKSQASTTLRVSAT